MNRTDSPAKQAKPFGINGPREPLLATTPAGDNTASYDSGFPPITMTLKSAGGLPPKGQDMNQILYELSALCRWASSGALYSFDQDFCTAISGYPKGSILLGDDGLTIFKSTADGNTNNPNVNTTGWFNLTTGYLLRANPFADIASDGSTALSTARTNLGVAYTISEPDSSTVIYTLPGGYKLMAFNRTVNNSSTVGTGVTTAITFPQAFPARVIAVFSTKRNYVQAAVSCENQTLTGFDAVVTLITTIAGGVTTTQAMFLAIGK